MAKDNLLTVIPLTPKLICTKCHAQAEAACDCGAPYVSAGEMAKRELEKDPNQSDSAIALRLGIGQATVTRTRQALGGATITPIRIGHDGKYRAVPKKKSKTKKVDGRIPKVRWEDELYKLCCSIISSVLEWDHRYTQGWRTFTPMNVTYDALQEAASVITTLAENVQKPEPPEQLEDNT